MSTTGLSLDSPHLELVQMRQILSVDKAREKDVCSLKETAHHIKRENQGQRVYFYLEGEFDIYCYPELKKEFLEAIDDGYYNFIIDLTKVTYIDSTFLGVVGSLRKKTREHRGKIGLVIQDKNIRRVFEITGLDRILLIYKTDREAEEGLDRGDKPIHN